jgi:hypothetical protein
VLVEHCAGRKAVVRYSPATDTPMIRTCITIAIAGRAHFQRKVNTSSQLDLSVRKEAIAVNLLVFGRRHAGSASATESRIVDHA